MRQCGGCTLCCKLVPVEELHKAAGQRCQHVRTGKGCAIYAKRPWSCREWTCMWIKGAEGADKEPLQLRRPDRSHYVVDEAPDIIRMRDNATGKVTQITVMQIWCDPLYPDAWQDPDLLAMLERAAVVALIRYDSVKGFAIFPPNTNTTGQWQRQDADSVEDLRAAQAQARLEFWRRAG